VGTPKPGSQQDQQNVGEENPPSIPSSVSVAPSPSISPRSQRLTGSPASMGSSTTIHTTGTAITSMPLPLNLAPPGSSNLNPIQISSPSTLPSLSFSAAMSYTSNLASTNTAAPSSLTSVTTQQPSSLVTSLPGVSASVPNVIPSSATAGVPSSFTMTSTQGLPLPSSYGTHPASTHAGFTSTVHTGAGTLSSMPSKTGIMTSVTAVAPPSAPVANIRTQSVATTTMESIPPSYPQNITATTASTKLVVSSSGVGVPTSGLKPNANLAAALAAAEMVKMEAELIAQRSNLTSTPGGVMQRPGPPSISASPITQPGVSGVGVRTTLAGPGIGAGGPAGIPRSVGTGISGITTNVTQPLHPGAQPVGPGVQTSLPGTQPGMSMPSGIAPLAASTGMSVVPMGSAAPTSVPTSAVSYVTTAAPAPLPPTISAQQPPPTLPSSIAHLPATQPQPLPASFPSTVQPSMPGMQPPSMPQVSRAGDSSQGFIWGIHPFP